MNYADVLNYLAPCGLDCGRCADYDQGEIKELSRKLLKNLGNYSRLARIKSNKLPIFENYDYFESILTQFSKASCNGCRGNNVICPLENCSAKNCHKAKGVDFCFQCDEYPCEKQFSGRLRDRWIEIIDRLKVIGVIEYYKEQSYRPRY